MIRSGTRYSSQTLPVRVAAAIRNLVGRKLAWNLRRPTRFAYRLTIYTARRIP